jgi:hypothetical protein
VPPIVKSNLGGKIALKPSPAATNTTSDHDFFVLIRVT